MALAACAVAIAVVCVIIGRPEQSKFASQPPGSIVPRTDPATKVLIARIERGTLRAWRKIRSGRGEVSVESSMLGDDYGTTTELYSYRAAFSGARLKVHAKLVSTTHRPGLRERIADVRRRLRPPATAIALRAGGPYRPLDATVTCDGRRVVEYRPGESFATEQSSTSGEGPGVLNCFREPITMLGNGIWLPVPARFSRSTALRTKPGLPA